MMEQSGAPYGTGSHASHEAAYASSPAGFDPSRVEWRNTKAQRETLRAKFNGRCAYCGEELGRNMHADHLEPCTRITTDPWLKPLPASERRMLKPERNTVANMMPACAACNLHKGGYSLEGWRDIIQRSAAIVAKQTSTFRTGERFGVITVSGAPVRFFFEKVADCPDCAEGIFPLYGVAPHECYWRKGPQFTLGQSTLLTITADDCFVPDLEEGETWDNFAYPSACGTFYCPTCHADEYREHWDRLIARIGEPPTSAIEAGTGETAGLDPKDESAAPQGETPNV